MIKKKKKLGKKIHIIKIKLENVNSYDMLKNNKRKKKQDRISLKTKPTIWNWSREERALRPKQTRNGFRNTCLLLLFSHTHCNTLPQAQILSTKKDSFFLQFWLSFSSQSYSLFKTVAFSPSQIIRIRIRTVSHRSGV